MATEYLTVGDVCVELVQWQTFRHDGLTDVEAAELMGLSPSTVFEYEAAVKALAALQSGAAPEAPGAAPDPTKEIHS